MSVCRLAARSASLRSTTHHQPARACLPSTEPTDRTQWMRPLDWGTEEDSALMLGAWRHGINAWDK